MADGGDAAGLTLFEVSKAFGLREALADFSLHVRPGEVVTLFGPNGAGKTTLLRIAAGLLRADRGRALVDGFEVARAPAAAKRRIGWAGDRPLFYGDLTLHENLVFFGRLYGLAPRDADAAATRALAASGLAHRAADPAGALSHGQRQRLSLARALLHAPTVLLLDEPFEGLDPSAQAAFLEVLRGDASRGARAVLLATHQVELGLAACDRAALMESGRLVRVLDSRGADAAALTRELRALGGGRPGA